MTFYENDLVKIDVDKIAEAIDNNGSFGPSYKEEILNALTKQKEHTFRVTEIVVRNKYCVLDCEPFPYFNRTFYNRHLILAIQDQEKLE